LKVRIRGGGRLFFDGDSHGWQDIQRRC
jgi:hypothetical protein